MGDQEGYATRANLDARNLLARAVQPPLPEIRGRRRHGARVQLAELHPRTEIARSGIQSRPAPRGPRPTTGPCRSTFILEKGTAGSASGSLAETCRRRLQRLTRYRRFKARREDERECWRRHHRERVLSADRGHADWRFQEPVDKDGENRELVDRAAPYKLNQYLYVSGGEGSLILNCTFGTPPAKL